MSGISDGGIVDELRSRNSAVTSEGVPPAAERAGELLRVDRGVLAAAVVLVVILAGTRGRDARPDRHRRRAPTRNTTVVIDSAILVFREGLETILVLAAIMASFQGANRALPAAGSSRRRVRDGRRRAHLVRRHLADRAVSRLGAVDPGRDRHPRADRAPGRDELVLSQGLLDRLDRAPQSPAAAC